MLIKMQQFLRVVAVCGFISATPAKKDQQQTQVLSNAAEILAVIGRKYSILENALSNLSTAYKQYEKSLCSLDNEDLAAGFDMKSCRALMENVKQDIQQCKPTFPPSCQTWRDAGFQINGQYSIDPDGVKGQPHFQVECNMKSQSEEAITIIHHDKEVRTNAGNCEAPMSCKHDITYGATMQQILATMSMTKRCEQFVKYDCYHANMHSGENMDVGWFSRDGHPVYSWGGAPTNSTMCACGTTNSCHNKNWTCNCDANDERWRTDEGLIDDKDVLPVSQLAFGDLGSSVEKGYFALGPLKCYG